MVGNPLGGVLMDNVKIKWSTYYEKSFEGLLEAMEFVVRKHIEQFEIQIDGGDWEDGREMLDRMGRLFG